MRSSWVRATSTLLTMLSAVRPGWYHAWVEKGVNNARDKLDKNEASITIVGGKKQGGERVCLHSTVFAMSEGPLAMNVQYTFS